MRRHGLYTVVAFTFAVSTGFSSAPAAGAGTPFATSEQPSTASPAQVAAKDFHKASDAACLRFGACGPRAINVSTLPAPEYYPDGLRWEGEWAWFRLTSKFTGNRIKLKVNF